MIERLHVDTGKAGGFLAQDWTDELARVSYELHEQLRDTLQADVGYRPVQSLAVAATAKGSAKQRSAKVPDWLDGKVSGGQVQLSHSLLKLCKHLAMHYMLGSDLQPLYILTPRLAQIQSLGNCNLACSVRQCPAQCNTGCSCWTLNQIIPQMQRRASCIAVKQ